MLKKKGSHDGENNVIMDIKQFFIECHNGKLIYLLAEHSLFILENNTLLLCRYKIGDAVCGSHHKCEIIDREEQRSFYYRSTHIWES